MGSIFASLLLVFSIFTLLSISEVNAEDVFVNAKGYENTIIIEFENDSTEPIKTIKMWPGGEVTFESFKTEPGWGGGKYSDGKLITFTATNTLDPGQSVKFGVITSEKITGMNWKTLDRNDQEMDKGKTSIQAISETESTFIEEESKEVDLAKETGDKLYGSKKFIPEKIRVGSDVRLVGNGFEPTQNLKFYLDNTILKSVSTDEQGNFLTTISIPDTYDAGKSEFIIKNESGNIQSTSINIGEAKDRFVKTTKFEVTNIPAEVRYDETLTISGNANPKSAIILAFENTDRILEKTRVITPNSNGEWVFEEVIKRDEDTGEKYVVIQNNHDITTKNLMIKSDYLVEISTSATRHNQGETLNIIGAGEPNQTTTIWIKDQSGKIIHYDVFTSKSDGSLDYQFVTDETISTGTYSVIMKQANGSDAILFGVDQYPSTSIVTLLEKTNFTLNSKAILSIVGPSSSKLSIKILDSNDSIKITDSLTTNSLGKSRYIIDLDGLSSGIYVAAVSTGNTQSSAKFSVGLEAGSGEISLLTTQENYSAGESILVLGVTGADARITITLYDPAGNVSSLTETFSDGSGNFSTNEIGIPTEAELGDWRITAHSRLDTKSIDINVAVPAEKGLTLEIDNTEFKIGDTVVIKGVGYSDSSRLQIEITNQNDVVVASIETPLTGDGSFSIPWQVPNNIGTGTYIITISDSENSDNIEIFIQ